MWAKHKSSECDQCKVTFEACGGVYSYNTKEFHIEQLCTAKVSCPNGCGEKINKSLVQWHRAICPNELVQCLYSEFGCFVCPQRKGLQEHVASCTQQQTLKLLRELRSSREEKDAIKQELAVLKTTQVGGSCSKHWK